MEQITFSKQQPQFDSLPVVKTIYYPWAIDAFKPYSYAKFAYVENKGLMVDFLAFERDPFVAPNVLDSSCVAVSFNFSPSFGEGVLVASINSKGQNEIYFSDNKQHPKLLSETVGCECYAGDDEQGWYWGVRFLIEQGLITNYFNVEKLKQGDIIKGNIYKFQKGEQNRHLGSAAKISDDFIFTTNDLLDFLII